MICARMDGEGLDGGEECSFLFPCVVFLPNRKKSESCVFYPFAFISSIGLLEEGTTNKLTKKRVRRHIIVGDGIEAVENANEIACEIIFLHVWSN